MKISKILVALSFLFAVSTANAGELAVTGSIQATYQSETDRTTGYGQRIKILSFYRVG